MRLSNKVLKQEYENSFLRKAYCWYGDLIKQYEVPFPEVYMIRIQEYFYI